MNVKQKNFLECWKKGVHLAGDQFFNIKSSDINSANDKEQPELSASLRASRQRY